MSKQKRTDTSVSEAENLLSQYRTRLATEGWIKSALCGLTVAFVLNIIYTFVCLLFGIKVYWVSAILIVAGAATTPLFYFVKFRKSLRQVASRVDTLGLEERVLTMAGLEGDDSFMARRQREDTIRALKTVNASLIKLAVSVPLIVMCATTFAVSATTTTVNALVDQPLLDLSGEQKEDVFYDVTYEVKGEGGSIAGLTVQKVKAGSVASPVQAIAEDGYAFAGWSDGYEEVFRADADVTGEIHVFAVFTLIDENDLPDPGDESESEGDEKDGSSKADQSGQQAPGQPDDPGDPSDEDPDDVGGGAGGASSPSNKYMDGKTYYGDDYSNSLSDAQDAMNSSTDLSGDQSDVIGDYFNNIAK